MVLIQLHSTVWRADVSRLDSGPFEMPYGNCISNTNRRREDNEDSDAYGSDSTRGK